MKTKDEDGNEITVDEPSADELPIYNQPQDKVE